MDIQLKEPMYIKRGKRYHEIGLEFTGWPSNGIWLVLDGRQSQIIKMGDIPKDPWPYIKLAKYQDEVADIIVDYRDMMTSSPMELAKKIIKVLAGKCND